MNRPFVIFLSVILFCFSLAAKEAKSSNAPTERTPGEAVSLDWTKPIPVPSPLTVSVSVKGGEPAQDTNGFGVQGKGSNRVDPGEALALRFQQDVMIDSIQLDAGKEGKIGGYLKIGNQTQNIVKTDRGNKGRKKSIVSLYELGLLKRGDMLILDPSPLTPKSPIGSWKLIGLTARPLPQ
ncbi:MAG TPA: hypothetical protein DCL00_01065 [Opitutae bacterium]|jgi:hypothetical protein|nr:hypothetical protein [Opitutae bacterium]|tara:strand:+ start:426 stop:965 length:540 start_codon:yes stop_codon:yes gene_type:complete